jgi:hypothetical protein
MLHREAKACRQSPLDKAAKWGENALRVIGTAKSIYDAGKTVYNFAQAAAPFAQAAMALL